MKKCIRCGLPAKRKLIRGKYYFVKYCRECYLRAYVDKSRLKNRIDALKYYSDGNPKCVCCNEEQIEFLVIDHTEGNGNKQRRDNRLTAGSHFYFWLKKNKYPNGYRVLCHNCNMSLGFYQYCPHNLKRES